MDKLRKFLPVFYGTALIGVLILMPELAFAQPAPAAGAAAGTIGGSIDEVGRNVIQLPSLFGLFSYAIGMGFIIVGLKKLKASADNPQQTPMSQGIMRLVIGGFLMAAPSVMLALVNTFGWGDTVAQKFQVLGSAPGAAPGAGGVPLHVMLNNFITNIRDPLINILGFVSYFIGGGMVLKGLMKSIRYADDGPKGQPGMGIIALLCVGAAMIALPGVLDSVGQSIGIGQGGAKSQFSSLSFNGAAASLSANSAEINMAAMAIFAFVQIIGLIGLIRGLNMLRAVGEGGQQNASMPAALTHIIGGAVAWNIVAFIHALESTLGISSIIT